MLCEPDCDVSRVAATHEKSVFLSHLNSADTRTALHIVGRGMIEEVHDGDQEVNGKAAALQGIGADGP